jgi:hypothetical protein
MDLNFHALQDACFAAARGAMWDIRPTDINKIKELANSFFTFAMSHVSRITEQGRDPNIVVRAVEYLAHTHAIPAMHDSREWFIFMLGAIIELACPVCSQTKATAALFVDIETGVFLARRHIAPGEAGGD